MPSSPPNRLSLERIREIWFRRRKLGIGVFLVALGAAAGLAVGLPALYRSTATLLVDPQPSDHAGDTEAQLQAVGQEVLSRGHLEELVTRFDLYPELRSRLAPEAIIERMRRDIHVELLAPEGGGEHSITSFSVSYQSRDPEVAAGVANTLAERYINVDSGSRGRRASGTAQAVKQELDTVKARLTAQEHEFTPQRTETNFQGLSEQLRVLSESRARTAERREALLKRLADSDPTGTSGDSDATAARVDRLNKELADLRQRYKDTYPDVVRIKAQIAELQGQAETPRAQPKPDPARASQLAPIKDALHEADAELESLKEQETALRQDLGDYRQHRSPVVTRGEGTRDYETTKEVYNALLKKYEEAQFGEGAGGQTSQQFRVLDKALPTHAPMAPNRPRVLLLGLALAVILSVAVVAFAEQADASFHSVDDLRGFTRVPVLASIPVMSSARERMRRHLRLGLGAALCLIAALLTAEASYKFACSNERLTLLLAKGHF
jgi:succinoglycan biosynthesis transport protein ExoP